MTQVKAEPNMDFGFGMDNINQPKLKPKLRKLSQTTNTKTIKAPGSATERVAQACDRCRAKKTKCDGKNPCSGCKNVGLECIVSDKLSRRAFPKGYTETLEIRIRQLEEENKRLLGLLEMNNEQSQTNKVTLDNLSLLENELNHDHDQKLKVDPNSFHHHTDGCPCGCSNPHELHERPVSIAGSIFNDTTGPMSIAGSVNLSDDDDQLSLLSIDDFSSINGMQSHSHQNKSRFGQDSIPAPGAWQAATAIAQMQRKPPQLDLENKQQLLTSLVAVSIPRSAEETLFIPTLLARICQAYGYSSKPAILTANAMASIKENPTSDLNSSKNNHVLRSLIMNRDELKLNDDEANFFVTKLIELPTKVDLDLFVTVYLQDWGNTLPILDKNVLLNNYRKLSEILEGNPVSGKLESDLLEKFGAIIVLILAMSLLSNKYNRLSAISIDREKYIQYLNHYDYLIHEFIKPNCIITKNCSIQSLQILALSLQYCLAVGDIGTCYELRGRLITMAQQLRLHRCPAAVLGVGATDDTLEVQNFMQGERRILFWCIYCLDIYSSLNLGVPRLLKDFEVECAMPFAGKNDDDDDDNVNILVVNNTKLSIHGKVSKFALSVITYCKVLGTIVDSIYTRYEQEETQIKASIRERTLDCWRRELPFDLIFDTDRLSDSTNDMWDKYSKQQLILIFLYYHAKFLIYLPIISKHGNHHNVGLSQKDELTKGKADAGSVITSGTMIQQSSIQMLEVLQSICKNSTTNILPIPINIPREQARFALLVAKGTLDYTKGGPLYQHLKGLLLETTNSLNSESSYEIPGSLTKKSVRLLEWSILSILGLNIQKSNIKKRIPSSIPSNQPITKTAVARDRYGNTGELNNSPFSRPQGTPLREVIQIDDTPQALDLSEQPSNDNGMTTNDGSGEDNDYLDSILSFDPFKVQVDRQMFSEFAADGSLGLGPYLEMNNNLGFSQTMEIFNDFNVDNRFNEPVEGPKSIDDWPFPI